MRNFLLIVYVCISAVCAAQPTLVMPSQLSQSGATSGQVLKWNGTSWAPAADATGGGGGSQSLQDVTDVGYITSRSIRVDSFFHARGDQSTLVGFRLENTTTTTGNTWELMSMNNGTSRLFRSGVKTTEWRVNDLLQTGTGYFGPATSTIDGVRVSSQDSVNFSVVSGVENKSSGSLGNAYFWSKAAGGNPGVILEVAGDQKYHAVIDATDSVLKIGSGESPATDAIYVNASNNVGIGIAASAKLHVSGSVRIDLGSDATGDVLYRSAGGNLSRLAIGTNGHVLTVSAGVPAWAAPSGGGGGSGKYIGSIVNYTTDANITAVAGTGYRLASGSITANRTIDFSGLTEGDIVEIYNVESTFKWSPTGGSPVKYANGTNLVDFYANARYQIRRVNGENIIIN